MKVNMKKISRTDGKDVYDFLCDIGFGENGFGMIPPTDMDHFQEILKKYIEESHLIQPVGRVPQEIFWMYINDEIVGIIKIRLVLNNELLYRGGNIGCSISKKYRGKGYGTLLLKEGLKICKDKGMDKVLVTILEDNIPSRKMVERNLGVLENIIDNRCRYWIYI